MHKQAVLSATLIALGIVTWHVAHPGSVVEQPTGRTDPQPAAALVTVPSPETTATVAPSTTRPKVVVSPKPVSTPVPQLRKVWYPKPETWIWPLDTFYIAPSEPGHFGLDLNVSTGCGATVYAVADGTVVEAKTSGWNDGYGNTVLIAHGDGIYTRYAHLQMVNVGLGSVAQRQVIGTLGNTGNAYGGHKGCHLHWEQYILI